MITARLINLRKLVLENPDELDLQEAVDQLLEDVSETVLGTKEEAMVERYVRYIQVQCTELMDLVSGLSQATDDGIERRTVVLSTLGFLLYNLQKYYPAYYDDHAPMSVFNVDNTKDILETDAKVLCSKLKQKIQDQGLYFILNRSIMTFFSLDTFSFAQLKRQRYLQAALLHFCVNTGQDNFEKKLLDYLVLLDYRDGDFLNYYLDKINLEFDEHTGLESQTRILKLYQKRLLTIRLIKMEQENQTLDILTAYIGTLEHKDIKIIPNPIEVSKVHAAKVVVPRGYRIKVSFSVDLLAYLTRLFIDCGFFQPLVKNELFAFLAARIETPGTGDSLLSPGSFSNKYHHVVQTTAVNARAMLMQMVKQIDREYNC